MRYQHGCAINFDVAIDIGDLVNKLCNFCRLNDLVWSVGETVTDPLSDPR